jgi:hypothetical protein
MYLNRFPDILANNVSLLVSVVAIIVVEVALLWAETALTTDGIFLIAGEAI